MCINPIITKFSRFRVFGNNRGGVWQSDRKLARNMQRLVESDEKATEDFWVRYFMQILKGEIVLEEGQAKEYAKGHLSAYLQEICIVVADELTEKFFYVQSFKQAYNHQDYFQIANLFTSHPDQLLRNFKFDRTFNLRAYVKKRLMGKVRDEILKNNQENQLLKYQDWALLRKIAKKELKLAIYNQLQDQEKVTKYLSIWLGFKEIYVPTISQESKGLESPTSEVYQQIADYYNQQYHRLSCSLEVVTAKDVQTILKCCIKIVREHLKIRFIYPDKEKKNKELSSRDYWEKVVALESSLNLSWNTLEKQDDLQQLNTFIFQAFAKLSPEEQTLLKLWKTGLGLTQVDIAAIFNCQQYQINRKLSCCRRKLLNEFLKIISTQKKIKIDEEKIAQLKESIEDYLHESFIDLLFYSLENTNKQDKILDFFEIEYYSFNLDCQKVIATVYIRTIKLFFSSILLSDINTDIEISLESYELIMTKFLCK